MRFKTRWSSISKKSRADIRKKNIESTFFSSEIQATDSALIGWMAKMSPAKNAPGICSRRKTRQRRSAFAACSKILTA